MNSLSMRTLRGPPGLFDLFGRLRAFGQLRAFGLFGRLRVFGVLGLRRSVGFIGLFGLLASSFACQEESERPLPPAFDVVDGAVTIHRESPLRFESTAVEEGPPLPYPVLTGRVMTVESLTSPTYAPLRGWVVESEVRLGDRVEAGQRLVRIQTAELPDIEHDVRAARLAVKTKEAMVARLRRMVEARVGSQNDLLIAESELAEARLITKRADARARSLTMSRSSESSYWVVAHQAGALVQLDATQGLQVGPDAPLPVATVADLDQVVVVTDVSQRDAAVLKVGEPATISIPGMPGKDLVGVLEVISEVVDPDRQTVPVRVRLENRERVLRANAYVDVTFAPPQDLRVVRAPRQAVIRDGARALVFVEEEPGVFRRRDVELGRQNRDLAEVVQGLAPGDRIVTRGALLLLNALMVEN